MKKFIFTLFLLHVINHVCASEMPPIKENYWQLKFQYARLYNYRYAKIDERFHSALIDSEFMNAQVANLDTGHIPTYTNLLGFMIQRKVWKFINLQTGFNMARRGYLGTYAKYPTYNSIFIVPTKVIFIPIILSLNFYIKKKFFVETGIGFETAVIYAKGPRKTRYTNPSQTLENQSSGFFGYSWNKNRKLHPETKMVNSGGSLSSENIVVILNFGYKFSERILCTLNGSYSCGLKYWKSGGYVFGADELNVEYYYKSKEFIFGFGCSLAFCF